MDLTWTDDGERSLFDYVALGLIVLVLLVCGLMSLGGIVAPFIVSEAYSQYNFGVSLGAAGIGVLLAIYLMMTWIPVPRMQTAIALVVLLGGMGYVSVAMGLPATVGSLVGKKATVVFSIADSTRGGRRSCAGVYVRHPDYVYSKVCHAPGSAGMRLEVTGKVSWFGMLYSTTRAY